MSVEEFIGIAQENIVVPVAQSLDELRNLELHGVSTRRPRGARK